MSDKNKKPETAPKGKELSSDELDNVSGGSLRNVAFTETVDISDDTKSKI